MEKMEESTEATMPEETELMDFPDEALLNIMIYLNDTTLLNMTRVCKRFKAIAKQAFTKKYNGKTKSFTVELFQRNLIVEREQYQPLFAAFGQEMIAIAFQFPRHAYPVAPDHWIFAMVRRFCTNLSKIDISVCGKMDLLKMFQSLPKSTLKHLTISYTRAANAAWSTYQHPNLICFNVGEGCDFQSQQLIDFISNNAQLQEIYLENTDMTDYVPLLKVIQKKCKNIRKLKIMNWNAEVLWSRDMVNILCKLNTLIQLEIDANGLKLSQLESLVRRLSNLSTLFLAHTAATSEIYENLTRAALICQNISKLKIRSKDPDFSKLNNDLLTHIADKIMLDNKMIVLLERGDKIEIMKGEVRRNKTTVYKQIANSSQSTTTFLDLNESCLAKIIGFLKPKQHSALYDTCQRTRKAIETHYSENVFCADFTPKGLTESVLWCLGKQIRSMKLKHYWFSTQNEFQELWRRINQHCTNLDELTIVAGTNISGEYFTVQTNCEWPSLKKLTFTTSFGKCEHFDPSSYALSYEILRSFFCPSLTQLEVISLEMDNNILDHGDHFRHLTVLKFGYFDESVTTFLLAFDKKVCEQMEELSIGSQLLMGKDDAYEEDEDEGDDDYGGPSQIVVELVRIISRFRKLTKLELIVPGVDQCYSKYLFESCTNLVHFGVWCKDEDPYDDLFQHIMDNCLDIGTIRLYGHGIYRKHLQKLDEMFPNASIEVAIQDNIAFTLNDEDTFVPSYIPEPN